MKNSSSDSRAAFPQLSDEEILRRLRAIKMSPAPERSARRLPSLRRVILISGMVKGHLYQIIDGKAGIGPVSRARLTYAFRCLDAQRERDAVRSAGGAPPEPEKLGFERNLSHLMPPISSGRR